MKAGEKKKVGEKKTKGRKKGRKKNKGRKGGRKEACLQDGQEGGDDRIISFTK